MYRIKVSCPADMPPLIRQLPFREGVELGNCRFYINEDVHECDYWFIHHSVEKEESTMCPPENVVLITAEPARIALYPNRFIKQFENVFSCQRNLIKRGAVASIPYSPWFAGAKLLSSNPWRWDKETTVKYEGFLRTPLQNRHEKLAVITSNKAFTAGHRKRLSFIYDLKSRIPDRVDIYGHGFLPISDKMEILAAYKYALIIENDSCVDYWTEKLADCFLSGCYPFYYGCMNIHEYFPADSLRRIDLSDVDMAVEMILNGIDGNIHSKFSTLLTESKMLILEKYNLFPFMVSYVNSKKKMSENIPRVKRILPVETFYSDVEFRIRNKIMRLFNIEL